jgi:hypothetical protein
LLVEENFRTVVRRVHVNYIPETLIQALLSNKVMDPPGLIPKWVQVHSANDYPA